MNFKKTMCVLVVLGVAALGAGPAQAETIELVTYFPSGGGGGQDPQVRSLRVGNAYAAAAAPGDGVALVFDALGIGIPAGGGNPAGALEVRGTAGQPDQALFLPGAGGTLNVGIGTNAPAAELHVVVPTTAGNPNADLFVERTGANPSVGMISAQGDLVAIGALSEDPLALTTNNTTRIFIREAAGNNATDGFVGIGNTDPQTLLHVGPAALLAQTDQGGSLELGGSSLTANPVANGQPYVDFHFGRVVGGNTVAQDFNARLINRADGILDVQTSIGGAAAQTQLSIGANIGVGTTLPQTTSPQNNVNTGNLDANDVFLRSQGQWLSQLAGGGRRLAVANVANFGNFVNFNRTWTVIGQITVTATGRPLLITVSYIVCNDTNPQKGFGSRIQIDGTGTNGAVVIQHGGGVQPFICEGSTLVCVHTPAAGQHTYFFNLQNGTNTANLRGQATQISVTELTP